MRACGEREREGDRRWEWERGSETAVARSLLETMVLARPQRAPQRPPAPKAGDKILIFKEPWLQRNYNVQWIPQKEPSMTSYEAFGSRMLPNSKCETAMGWRAYFPEIRLWRCAGPRTKLESTGSAWEVSGEETTDLA